jgi:hypothetical protein
MSRAEKPADTGEGGRSLLQRVTSSSVVTGLKNTWQKANPWAHEHANARQVDTAAKPQETMFSKDAKSAFGRVDTDRNGTLTNHELTAAVGSSAFRNGEAAAVGTMHKFADDIEDLSNDERILETRGITRKDLDQFEKLQAGSDLGSRVRSTYYNGLYKIERADRHLYGSDGKGVRGEVVEQGGLGDCYFLAGVASQAAQNPEAIKRMIRANADGTYTVSFPGRKPVTVTAPTDAELARYASTGGKGIWLNVLEKAYAQSRNDSRLIARGDMYKAIEGGFGKQTIKTMTGHSSNRDLLWFTSAAELKANVQKGQAEGRLMTIATGPGIGRDRTKANNLPTRHEYTMLGYDETSGKFRIRNPWGSEGPKDDGMLELTAEEVKKNFLSLTIEKR